MFSYAITVNPGHAFFHEDIQELINDFIVSYRPQFIHAVCHDHDHFHVLLCVDDEIIPQNIKGSFHLETVRNHKAYIKYMQSHDLVDEVVIGELPYIEEDSIIDYIIAYGPQKAVQKFGWQALKQYSNIKAFWKDVTNH